MAQDPLIVNCPTCGAAMTLDEAYLAQYGGQTTTCPNCRQPFTIPAPGAQQGPGVISYANPYASAGMLFDDGVGLVMQKSAVAPDRCVKCNEPANGYRWTKTFYWHDPLFYLLILAGIIIYAIVALIIRKSGRISVGLCPRHRAARARRIWIAWGLFLLGLALLIGGPMLASNFVGDQREQFMMIGVLGGIFTLLASGIFAAVAVPVLTPRKIDDHYVYLARAGRPFLDSLPKIR